MWNKINNRYSSGFSLLEALIALGILVMVAVAIMSEIFYGQRGTVLAGSLSRATFIAEEGMAALKNIADGDFFSLDPAKHGLSLVNGVWQLTDTPQSVESFLRRVDITDIDSRRKLAAVKVSWENYEVEIKTRFNHWSPTVENWSQATVAGSLDLNTGNVGTNSHKPLAITTQQHYLYVGGGTSAGKEFAVFNIGSTALEPNFLRQVVLASGHNLTYISGLDLSGNVNDLAVCGDYVYAASSDPNEFQVVNVANKSSPALAAVFDLTVANSGHANLNAVSVAATSDCRYVFLGRDTDSNYNFFVFDVGNPAAPVLLGKTQLPNTPTAVKTAVGDNNFVFATGGSNLLKIDVNNPALPFLAHSLGLGVIATARDLDLTATRAYMGTTANAAKEVLIADISAATSILLSGGFDLGGTTDARSVSFSPGNNVLLVVTSDDVNDVRILDMAGDAPIAVKNLTLTGPFSISVFNSIHVAFYVAGQVPPPDPEIAVIMPFLSFTGPPPPGPPPSPPSPPGP